MQDRFLSIKSCRLWGFPANGIQAVIHDRPSPDLVQNAKAPASFRIAVPTFFWKNYLELVWGYFAVLVK